MAKQHPNSLKNLKKGTWKKGQSGNPNGRPKKTFSKVNDELKKKGYNALKKRDLIEAYLLLFNCDEDTLKELASRNKIPYALKIIIFELNNASSRMAVLQDIRDYCFGGKVYNTELTVLGEISHIQEIKYRPETLAMMLKDAGDINIEESFIEIEADE